MRYLGGKFRIAKDLTAVMAPVIAKADKYIEPFVGAANVLVNVNHPRRFASDANPYLITLWQHMQLGWEPPNSMSEDEYHRLKVLRDVTDPLTAFAGFGMSFAGKWFAGYCRSSGTRQYARAAARGLVAKRRNIKEVSFTCRGYETWTEGAGAVYYCDPPYSGTTGYNAVGAFDSAAFYDWCRERAEDGATVFVSEYTAPDDLWCVWDRPVKTDMHGAGRNDSRSERLFMLGGDPMDLFI